MEDEYISNMNSNDIIDENETLQKLKKTEAELVENKNILEEKNKLCLTQKHQIEEYIIEVNNLNDKIKNQENLIKFYQDKSEQEENETETDPEKKDKIKQLEIKNFKLSETIKELEENKIKLENDYDVLEQELEEEKAINQKALEYITEKDDEIEELKKKLENKKTEGIELSEEEIQALKEEFVNQQEEYEQYKEETTKKIQLYIEENNSLLNETTDLKDKISSMEMDISRLKEIKERLENEKRISEKLLEENNLKEDNKINELILEIQNLHNQLEETQSKNTEILSQQREASKYEREEFEKIIKELKEQNKELEINISSLKEDLTQKESELQELDNKLKEKEKEKEKENIENKMNEDTSNEEHKDNNIKSKDEEINDIKKNFEEKEKEIKKQLEEKDKRIQELINKNEKENNNYVKKIHDLTNQLNTINLELNEFKKKKRASVRLDEMLDNPQIQLEDQLDESKRMVQKLKEENTYYEKQIEALKKDSAKAKKCDELEAKLKFSEDTIETMKNNINELKEQKKKAQDDFDQEINSVKLELNKAKCEWANVNYEKDLIKTNMQRYINKLKNKMGALGFNIKSKKVK